MMNPIMQMLNRNNNNQLGSMMNIMNILKNGNPNAIYDQMLKGNPQFRSFVDQNKGKTPEQIAEEYGVDFNQIKSFLYK